MGKDLKGKELGTGITQIKNGNYVGRFVSKSGKRIKKEFKKLQECRRWLANAKHEDELYHGNVTAHSDYTVDQWFSYWFENVKKPSLKYATQRMYTMCYRLYIHDVIGSFSLADVKPMHCQMVLSRMKDKNLSKSTIDETRLVMHMMFDYAEENELIRTNPVKKSVKAVSAVQTTKKTGLTLEEERKFLEGIKGCVYENQFRFILQTGVRVGELAGLTWANVDFDNHLFYVKQRVFYVKHHVYDIGEPKTKSGIRMIPLTKIAEEALRNQQVVMQGIVPAEEKYRDFVFLNKEGYPIRDECYNQVIAKICDKVGIRRISVHILRHTFATRCIEGGIKPKTLQTILGHSDLSMTMNIYVETTKDESIKEMKTVENYLASI